MAFGVWGLGVKYGLGVFGQGRSPLHVPSIRRRILLGILLSTVLEERFFFKSGLEISDFFFRRVAEGRRTILPGGLQKALVLGSIREAP